MFRTASHAGSPPRVRGKPLCIPAHVPPVGITPARAGKTCSAGSRTTRRRDHPRACGENRARGRRERNARGSPPRVRGKQPYLQESGATKGITPARAGKTALRRNSAGMSEDHPRACGENTSRMEKRIRASGSPPRVRGKLERAGGGGQLARITPARAGKTTFRRS